MGRFDRVVEREVVVARECPDRNLVTEVLSGSAFAVAPTIRGVIADDQRTDDRESPFRDRACL